jgi:hypothetical protein
VPTKGFLKMNAIRLFSFAAVLAWTCIVSADEGTNWGYGQAYYTSQEEIPVQPTPEGVVAAPEAMPYEAFPEWSYGTSSYRGLGYTGFCCESPSYHAQSLWQGYCYGPGGHWYPGLFGGCHVGLLGCHRGAGHKLGCGHGLGCCGAGLGCCGTACGDCTTCAPTKHCGGRRWQGRLQGRHLGIHRKGKGAYEYAGADWNTAEPVTPDDADGSDTDAETPIPPAPTVDQPTHQNTLPNSPNPDRSARTPLRFGHSSFPRVN